MPEVKIRPSIATDLSVMAKLDHTCNTEYVWQVDIRREEGQVLVSFREIRLPRPVHVDYPRSISIMADEWRRRDGMLAAQIGDEIVGYMKLTDRFLPTTTRITDLVVDSRYRRQGVATSLILYAQAWALDRHNAQLILEMTSKNNPMVCLARKLGFEFCGYNDHYYMTKDVALFFYKTLK
jgi:ribosomal protein S18 acetylase RimI-like enzyme